MQPSELPFRSRIRIALLTSVLLLTGCASLSEKQCRTGDWQGIGYRDGTNGYTEFRVSDHQKACAKYDIAVDGKTYEIARQRGIERYCTIAGGLRAGRHGDSYAGVCPVATEGAFMHAYQLGLEINRLTSRLDAVKSERSSVYYRLREMEEAERKQSPDDRTQNDDRRNNRDNDRGNGRNDRNNRERDVLMHRLRELEREESRLDADYMQLEWEARRLR